jgi:hypothetical protein
MLPAPHLCHRLALALVILAPALFGASAADNQPPAGSSTLELPTVKVTDSPQLPPPESWLYARVGGFEVLSNAPERTTRRLLADFGMFTRAMSLVWPVQPKPLAGSTLILCGRKGRFDSFAPAGTLQNDSIVPSLLLRNREQAAIIVDVEADRLTTDTANVSLANSASAEYEVDHFKQLYREYIRFLISQSQARIPIWLEEGLAQIIMDVEFDDERLIYGKINTLAGAVSGGESADSDGTDPSAAAGAVIGEQPFNVVLQNRKLIPLDRFLATPSDSPEARNPLGNNLWAKQAYAFVHFCLFGEDLRYQQALSTFITRLAREPLSEALFKDCFKVDYTTMAKQLRGYILHTRHKYQRYALKPEDRLTPKSIELRDASIAESARLTGDALRLANRHDLALAAYRSGYLRGHREPAILAGMGLAEDALGHADRARELLEPAAKSGVALPSAHVTLARLRLAEAATRPAADGKLSPEQMTAILTPLFEARKLQPALPETYELIAEAWARSALPPKPEHLAVLDEGIRAFPRDSALLYRAAQLYQQAGAAPTAGSIARLGLRFAADDTAKARFEQLLANLPPAAK